MNSSMHYSSKSKSPYYIAGEIHLNGFLYPNIQVNGQRHVGPVKNWQLWGLHPPCYEREIWIGNIPPAWTEIELMKHFMKVGLVYYLRFMVNFSGQSRGFAYVQFVKTTAYTVACLNNFFKLYDLRIYANWSFNIRKLEIGNFYPYLQNDYKYLLNMLKTDTKCEKAELLVRCNKLSVILTYQNNRQACLSRRFLFSNIEKYGNKTYIYWFDRKNMKYVRGKNIFSNPNTERLI